MGTGGPGNVVHIDNLYVKDFAVKTNTSIVLGDFVVFDTDGVRPLSTADITVNDTFLDIQAKPVFQAGESSNNLTTTPVDQRKPTCECFTRGTDISVVMRAGVLPDKPVGILRVDGATPVFQVSDKRVSSTIVAAKEVLGIYKHKEFSTQADTSIQADNGIVTTGGGVS